MKAELLEALKYVATRAGECTWTEARSVGICGSVFDYFAVNRTADCSVSLRWAQDYLTQLFAKWPKHSGDKVYPVPHPTESSGTAYDDAEETESLWDPSTEYGALRWELLEFCISELEKELNDE